MRRSWLSLLFLGLLSFLLGVALMWKLRDRLIPPRVEQLSEVRSRRVLIAFLSPVGGHDVERLEQSNGAVHFAFKANNRNASEEKTTIETLRQLAEHDANLGPWQQLARGILPHLKDLQRVMLLPSSNASGGLPSSMECAEKAVEVFTNLISNQIGAGRNITVETVLPAADFENFHEVMDQLERAIRRCASQFALSDMVIDVTGGQKTTSIAGALTTLDKRELDLQYVPTGPAAKRGPKGYRVSTPTLDG